MSVQSMLSNIERVIEFKAFSAQIEHRIDFENAVKLIVWLPIDFFIFCVDVFDITQNAFDYKKKFNLVRHSIWNLAQTRERPTDE